MTKPSHRIQFLKQNWMILSALCLAICVGLWFLFGVISDLVYFNDPRNRDADIKAWMTPRYIVMSYDLPRSVVADLLELSSLDQRRMPMRDVAAAMGVTLDELTEIVRAGAADYRAGQP